MTLAKTSKGSKLPSKDGKRSRSASSRSRSRSVSRSSSSGSSRSSSSSSRSSSGSRSRSRSRSRSSRSSSSSASSRSTGYKRRFRGDSDKRAAAPRKRSVSPHMKRLYIGRLTRNVNKDHIHEIFGAFGKVLSVEMPMDRNHPHLSRGFAYVEFDTTEDAEKALKFMDGGQIDGQEISASKVDLQRGRGGPPPPPQPRRGGGAPGWRQHGSPIRRRRSPPRRSPPRRSPPRRSPPRRSPPRRSPPARRRVSRSRSRTPIRDRRRRDSRSSSGSSR